MLPGNHSIFLWCIYCFFSSKNNLKILDDNFIPFLCFSNLHLSREKYHLSREKRISQTPATIPTHAQHLYLFVVQLLSCVQLFVTTWTAARQAPLSFTISQSLLKLVHWVGDAIQLSHPLSSPSPPALNLSQHQGLFQWSACISVYSTFTWISFFSTSLISPSIPNHSVAHRMLLSLQS